MKTKKPLKVRKDRFDAVLSNLIQAKPVPRTSVKSTGRRGSKKPILQKP
jgi:hypothetical protein